ITSFTFLTASSTPLPPKRLGSPSRSSTASCSPVDAPLGTAAVPTAPLARVTSVSTVGLPRLSRISRAWTEMSVLTVERTLPRLRLKGNHRRPHVVPQPLAIFRTQPGRGNGRRDEQLDGTGPKPPGTLRQNLKRVVDVNGNDRNLSGNREAKRRILEGQQLAGAAARPFRKNADGGGPALYRPRRLIVRLERLLAGGTIDRNVAGGLHRAPQQRDLEELLLGDEAHRCGQRRKQRPDVEHRRVIRGIHHQPVARDVLEALGDHRRPRRPEYIPRPVRAGPVIDAADPVAHAKQPGHDGNECMNDCRNDENYIVPEGADTHAK